MALLSSDQQVEVWHADCVDDRAVTPTGYTEAIDRFLKRGGLEAGWVMALVGRSGVGKSFLAVNLADRLKDYPTLFSTQEMRAPQLISRLACISYDLPLNIVDQRVSEGFYQEALKQYREDFQGLTVYDHKRPTFEDLSQALVDAEGKVGERPRAVIQDHLRLMTRNGYPQHDNQRVPRLAEDFQVWAQEEGVAVILVCQTGRAHEGDVSRRNHGHIPLTQEDLMYGGEQDMTQVLGLYRPEKDPALYDPKLEGQDLTEAQVFLEKWRNKAVLQLPKNRFGPENPQGTVLEINRQSMRFTERAA